MKRRCSMLQYEEMHVFLFVHVYALQWCVACSIWQQLSDLNQAVLFETVSMNANKTGKGGKEAHCRQTRGTSYSAWAGVSSAEWLAVVSDETSLSTCCSARVFCSSLGPDGPQGFLLLSWYNGLPRVREQDLIFSRHTEAGLISVWDFDLCSSQNIMSPCLALMRF